MANRPVWFDDRTVLVEAEGPEEQSHTVRIQGAERLTVDAGDDLTVVQHVIDQANGLPGAAD